MSIYWNIFKILKKEEKTMDNVWDLVWKQDKYALKKIRKNKAKKKFDILEQMGVEFLKYESVADFGAGGGYMTLELLERYINVRFVKLYDFSDDAILKAKKNLQDYKNVDFMKMDLNRDNNIIEEKYDFAMAFSVLEHIENYTLGLDTIYNSLKDDGELILVWSNKNSIFRIERKLSLLLKSWNYGFQIEMSKKQLDDVLKNKFSIISYNIVPCVGDKGVWTFVDRLIHKVNYNSGRYIFLYLRKLVK